MSRAMLNASSLTITGVPTRHPEITAMPFSSDPNKSHLTQSVSYI